MRNVPPCSTCRCWDQFSKDATRGLCRRYSAQPSDMGHCWPVVQADDGCGEHQPMELEEAK